jgi:integrase
MQAVSLYAISPKEWVNDSSLCAGSTRNRQRTLRYLERANNSNITEILDDIVNERVTVYSVCKRFVDDLRKKNRAPMTIYVFRSQLPSLFQSVLGEEHFSRTVFDRLVPNGAVYVVTRKKIPPVDGVRRMVEIASPQYRAIVSGLAVSGMRIGEWLSRRMSDLEIRNEGYARVTLRANETKGRYLRYTFLTREVVDFVKIQQMNYPSEYVFKGETYGHLKEHSVQQQIKNVYRNAGLLDSEHEIYCAHSFRTFADSMLRSFGLDSKYVSAIIGHKNKLQAEASYLDWSEIEHQWVEKCADKLTFLTRADPEQKKEIERLENRNDKLELLLTKLLERLT